MIKRIIHRLEEGKILSESEAFSLQSEILSGRAAKEEIIRVFELFDARRINAQELLGIFDATRQSMKEIKVPFDVLDTAGTGGDGLHTFNISTVAAIICAACGVPVAKHGNRSASSKCGSADVLEALGVKIDLNPEEAAMCLKKAGIAFLFAPLFHPALRLASEARKAFGNRTFFNFLGPMLNPVKARYQIIGIYDPRFASLIGETLLSRGAKRLWIIHSRDNMDEISPASKTSVEEFSSGVPRETEFVIDPLDYGFKLSSLSQIQSESVQQNARIFLAVLKNESNEGQKNAAILNAAAGLTVFGKAKDYGEGIAMARKALESGDAYKKLQDFINASNHVARARQKNRKHP